MILKCFERPSILCLNCLATIFLLLAHTALGQPLKAKEANAFVDSVGVNIHLHYYDTAYADFEGKVLPSLAELGVRHIRDGICPVGDDTKLGRLRTLFTELGIRATLIIDPRCISAAKASLHIQRTLGTGLLAALEGPNEYDLSGEQGWSEKLRVYQTELYSVVKGVARTAAVPVIGPSVTSEEAAQALGNVTASADVVNLHAYYSFRPPETQGWGDNGYGSLSWRLEAMAQPLGAAGPNKPPLIVTEAGYHNVYQNPEAGLPEEVTAVYLPRLLLNHFNAGITRTFIYELLDEWDEPYNKEANFGLIRFDGSRKPAFVALENLLELLNDPGRTFLPGLLNVTLKATKDTLTWTLMQKRDGDFYLAVWDGAAMFDPKAEEPEVISAEQTVTLTFGEAVTAVSRVLPNDGVAWEHLPLTGSSLDLEVGSKVTLLRISTPHRPSAAR